MVITGLRAITWGTATGAVISALTMMVLDGAPWTGDPWSTRATDEAARGTEAGALRRPRADAPARRVLPASPGPSPSRGR